MAEDRQVGAQQRQRMQRLAVLSASVSGRKRQVTRARSRTGSGKRRSPASPRARANPRRPGCQRRCKREDRITRDSGRCACSPLVRVAHHHRVRPRSPLRRSDPATRARPRATRCQASAHTTAGERKHHGQRDQRGGAEAVGEGAMPEHHGGERGHVDRQGSAAPPAGWRRAPRRSREGGQIGVDRERADRGQGDPAAKQAGMGERSGHVRLEGRIRVCCPAPETRGAPIRSAGVRGCAGTGWPRPPGRPRTLRAGEIGERCARAGTR